MPLGIKSLTQETATCRYQHPVLSSSPPYYYCRYNPKLLNNPIPTPIFTTSHVLSWWKEVISRWDTKKAANTSLELIPRKPLLWWEMNW